ncbi:hypothetical protein [Piscinibacter koreensis]|uniref:Uncharacterized protein n=1 Tax=Piscinibacter koreensis TaxID=2742824 RepID=A0A7Y6NME9_9BURK|nr:hypothetical protein [Schlegelella koreensis]NUZ05850.1 hypothetical protein [Schlegelella koreensis]
MFVDTDGLEAPAGPLLLRVLPSPALASLQAAIAAAVPGQHAVVALHVTLCMSALDAAGLPAPPACVELLDTAPRLTGAEGTTSVWLPLANPSQQALAAFVQALARQARRLDVVEPGRVFHVSLCNRSGERDDSVAEPWRAPSEPLPLEAPARRQR